MNPTLVAYTIYLSAVTATIIGVSTLLFRHSAVFLHAAFGTNTTMVAATGGALKTQFRITALALMLLLMAFGKTGAPTTWISTTAPTGGAEIFEALSIKIGLMLLLLGGMHFLTLRLVNRIRTTGGLF